MSFEERINEILMKEVKKVLNEFPEPYIGGIGWCTFRIEEIKQFKTKLHGILALLQDHEQKLREFEELLENRPKFYLYRCDEKDSFILALKEVGKYFELLEKKFEELTK